MSGPVFVVQLHQATRLHYDLRLEVGGVLVSWAVPKGPSLDPAVRRLAVRVPDHELGHASFEGRAGSGAVVVWDTGTYANRTVVDGRLVPVAEALEAGHVHVELFGRRLTGDVTLHHTGTGGEANWLMVKGDDAGAVREGPAVTEATSSVLTGRTLADLLGEDELL